MPALPTYLHISTMHLSGPTTLVDNVITKYDEGWFLYVGEENAYAANVAPEVRGILDYARSLGADLVRIDEDAPECSELPIYPEAWR